LAAARFEVASAGTEATYVKPESKAVLHKIGSDISGQDAKTLERFLTWGALRLCHHYLRVGERGLPVLPVPLLSPTPGSLRAGLTRLIRLPLGDRDRRGGVCRA